MLTIFYNTKSNALSQFTNFAFNSLTAYRRSKYGANSSGIYQIGEAGTDDGTAIEAYLKLAITDFGITNSKRLQCVLFTGKASAKLELSVIGGMLENSERTYDIDILHPDAISEIKVPVGRDGEARYWQIKIANTLGCDFAIDSVDVVFLILGKIGD